MASYQVFTIPKKTKCVAHYTRLSNIPSILDGDGILLWSTRFNGFSDNNEYKWALDEIYPLLPEIAKETESDYDEDQHAYPYIISFSNNIDNDWMWKEYADNHNGVMLIFDRLALYGHCCSHISQTGKYRFCSDVEYSDTESLRSKIFDTFNRLQDEFPNSPSMDVFIEVPALIKNEEYKDENEFRIVDVFYDCRHFTAKGEKSEYEEAPQNLLTRVKDNMLIPYTKVCLPKESLVGIVLGRNVENQENINSLDLLLRARGYKARIFRTNTHYT